MGEPNERPEDVVAELRALRREVAELKSEVAGSRQAASRVSMAGSRSPSPASRR